MERIEATAEFARTAWGGQGQFSVEDSRKGGGGNTLNVVPGPFATRSALRGHGQLGLGIFFHLERRQVSSRSQPRWISRDLLT